MQLHVYDNSILQCRVLHPRNVLRPAIWVGVTGRLVEYPKDMFDSANEELDEILAQAARISLDPETSIKNYPPLPIEASEACLSCPFHQEPFPICGPIKQDS